ncbi:hypothetical protein VSR68_22825 [Paraburkholderia phymatum]|uniref:hypothetical protein n=1 Tax=Paraburkholderia phymatum TaxID=148447 RepID=UPI00316E1D8D
MGRREDIREELEELGKEIEEVTLRSRCRRSTRVPSIPETHICIQLFIPRDATHCLEIHVSTEEIEDSGRS